MYAANQSLEPAPVGASPRFRGGADHWSAGDRLGAAYEKARCPDLRDVNIWRMCKL
jgi:hypothetical protein